MAGAVSQEEIARMDELVEAHSELREELELQTTMDVALAVTAAMQPGAFSKSRIVPFPMQPMKSRRLLAWLGAAAALVVFGGFWWRGHSSADPTVAVLSPLGLSTTPLLTWENKGDLLYDVWILPEGADQATTRPLFKSEDRRSPLAFTEMKATPDAAGKTRLEPGRSYALLVCLANTDRMTGTMVPFAVDPSAPTSPAAAFLKLQELLQKRKTEEAKRFLENLQADWRSLPEIKNLENEVKEL